MTFMLTKTDWCTRWIVLPAASTCWSLRCNDVERASRNGAAERAGGQCLSAPEAVEWRGEQGAQRFGVGQFVRPDPQYRNADGV